MTLNKRLMQTLSFAGIPAAPGVYTEKEETYYTFNYDLIPCQFADGAPIFDRALIQVHLFCPVRRNSIELRRKTRSALLGAGFTWAGMVDASEKDTQHFVFECEAIVATETEELL